MFGFQVLELGWERHVAAGDLLFCVFINDDFSK